jgi:hypothetical protein
MEEVGIELESTEVEDSEECVILYNESKDLDKIPKRQKEMKKILIKKQKNKVKKIGQWLEK